MNATSNYGSSEPPHNTSQEPTPSAAASSSTSSSHGSYAMPTPVHLMPFPEAFLAPRPTSMTTPLPTATSNVETTSSTVSSAAVNQPKRLHRRRRHQHQQALPVFAPLEAMSNDDAKLASIPNTSLLAPSSASRPAQNQNGTFSDPGSFVPTLSTTIPLANVIHSEGNTYWARTTQRRLRCDEAAHCQHTDHERLRHKKRSNNQPSDTWDAFIATPTSTSVTRELYILPNTASL